MTSTTVQSFTGLECPIFIFAKGVRSAKKQAQRCRIEHRLGELSPRKASAINEGNNQNDHVRQKDEGAIKDAAPSKNQAKEFAMDEEEYEPAGDNQGKQHFRNAGNNRVGFRIPKIHGLRADHDEN